MMDPTAAQGLRARRVAACLVVCAALYGCATANRNSAIPIASRDPSHVGEVVPGKLYRSGQLTTHGMQKAITDHGIRTVINLRGEDPDPDLGDGQREREFCTAQGMRYVHLGVHPERDDLFPSADHPERPLPPFIQTFLTTMDDSSNWPVLIHCAGGKHRTGLLVGTYRIVKEGRSAAEASAEMMSYGFEPSDFRRNPHILPYLEYLETRSAAGSPLASAARTAGLRDGT